MIALKRLQKKILIISTIVSYTSCSILSINENNGIANPKNQNIPKLRSYYKFIDSTHPYDDFPSSCDCDYNKIELYLMEDSSFVLKDQKGRLKIISLNQKYGTWEIDSHKTLQLNIDSTIQSSELGTIKEKYNSADILRMKIYDNKLIDYDGKVLITTGKVIETNTNK